MTGRDPDAGGDEVDDGGGAEDLWSRLERVAPAAPPASNPVPPAGRVDDPTAIHRPATDARPNEAVPSTGPRQFHVAAPGETVTDPSPSPGGSPVGAPPPPPPPSAPQGTRPSPRARTAPTRPSRARRWFRPKLRWLYLYLPLLIVLVALLAGVWGWRKVEGLGRVDVGDALVPADGDAINYLIVGSDTRDGVDADRSDVGVIGTDVAGERADTIIVLRAEGDRSQMMSIPRDLWVTNPATGNNGRINGTYNQGAENLVDAVSSNLGIPVNRYMEVDFVSFGSMVDALGGIEIDFPYPVVDVKSGLAIGEAGPQVLDGTQALAYVRSRTYTENVDGTPRVDPTGDLGRQQRQQDFIRSLMGEVGATRNPWTLVKVGNAASEGVRVDQDFGVGDAWTLMRKVAGTSPETVVLPTDGANIGGASVLLLRDAEAIPVLEGFGAE